MADPSEIPLDDESKIEACPLSTTHDAHDLTSLSDLPGRRMRTKLWPMSPIESLTQEEVMAIANRDQTPVLIAVMDGDDSGEKYLCANKKGVTLPPEVAAEGSWAKKYYQQVAVLNESLKEMQDSFQPVWELAKSQQALLVSVEVFDGLLQVANQGLQLLYRSWTHEEMQSIITRECDFRVQKQVHYYSVLKNYTMKKFDSLDQARIQNVEDLLLAGETYLIHHARSNGFNCPADIRALFQEFLPLKRDRNEYSHPLTLARKRLASTVLQKLRASVVNNEFEFIKNFDHKTLRGLATMFCYYCSQGTKDLILLGADYAETVLQSYGKVRQKLFLDPKRRSKKRPRDLSPDGSPEGSPPHSPRSPISPLLQAQHLSFEKHFQVGQSSQSPPLKYPYDQHPESPQSSQTPQHSSFQRSHSLGSPLVLTDPHGSETLLRSQSLSVQIPESSQSQEPGVFRRHRQSAVSSPSHASSLESSPESQSSPCSQSTDTRSPGSSESPNSPIENRLTFKRPRE